VLLIDTSNLKPRLRMTGAFSLSSEDVVSLVDALRRSIARLRADAAHWRLLDKERLTEAQRYFLCKPRSNFMSDQRKSKISVAVKKAISNASSPTIRVYAWRPTRSLSTTNL